MNEKGAVEVRVLLFAQLRDRVGSPEVSLSLPPDPTGADLLEVLGRGTPGLAPLLEVSRLVVGQEYVSWDHPLRESDEIAVIPPVSGG